MLVDTSVYYPVGALTSNERLQTQLGRYIGPWKYVKVFHEMREIPEADLNILRRIFRILNGEEKFGHDTLVMQTFFSQYRSMSVGDIVWIKRKGLKEILYICQPHGWGKVWVHEYSRCERCGDYGYMDQFMHVNMGTCFKCNGSGASTNARVVTLADFAQYVETSPVCTICRKNWVDVDNGYDTCQNCLNQM